MSEISHGWDHPVSPHDVDRAVKLSYVQSMLMATYVGCTSGGFAIGYALMLGATDVQIGLLTALPMLAVVMQLVSALAVERGVNRRRFTVLISIVHPMTWILVILLPFAIDAQSKDARIAALIAIFILREALSSAATNVRAGWIGDLIPSRRLGRFFGRVILYSGIIQAATGIGAGKFLDRVKTAGLPGFGWVYAIGAVFGLVNAALYVPQADVPAKKHEHGSLLLMVRDTFRNRQLMSVAVFVTLFSSTALAGPFYPAYLLRDVGISFMGLSLLNTVSTVAMLASSPFWGRIVERYGCRPVLIACTAGFIPVPAIWIWATNPRAVYEIVAPINLFTGLMAGGTSVALNTMLYKVTPEAGRTMQFAIYTILVTAFIAPLPAIGGHIPDWLHCDLRVVFWMTAVCYIATAYAGTRLKEPGSRPTAEMLAAIIRRARRTGLGRQGG